MSFDSFKSSTLGPEAVEARKKLEEQRKKEVAERRAYHQAAEAKRAEWQAFQSSISSEYEKPAEVAEGANAERLKRAGFMIQDLKVVPQVNGGNVPQPNSSPRLKRF